LKRCRRKAAGRSARPAGPELKDIGITRGETECLVLNGPDVIMMIDIVGTWQAITPPAEKFEEETMNRFAPIAVVLLCLIAPSTAMCGSLAKMAEVNGVRIAYVEQGSGEPIRSCAWSVFRPSRLGADQRGIAKRYRFIAYTQRYFGTGPWADDGKNFSVATDADDLLQFITALNVGPVHLVTRSRGGVVATAVALRNPSLVRSLVLHEPALISVVPAESEEGKTARDTRKTLVGSAVAAAKAGFVRFLGETD
jgi:hypothetical protein